MSDAQSFTIRQADPTNIAEYEAIDELIVGAYAHDYGPGDGKHVDPMQRSQRRAEDFDVWIALDGSDELLGSVTLRRRGGPALHEDVTDDELDLRLLGVSPNARRRGVGAALMRHATAVASRDGFDAVVLKTGPNMVKAHQLYESLGFERVPERDGLWIGGERVLDLVTYALSLRDWSAESTPTAS